MRKGGSEKRKRTRRLTIRFDEREAAAVKELADKRGLSPGALLRQTLLNVPPGPATHRPPNNKAIGEFLAGLGRARDAVRSSEAELGKANSNVNQIAYMLNAGRPPERMQALIETVLQEHLTAQQLHNEVVSDFRELRLVGMQALGHERNRKPPQKE